MEPLERWTERDLPTLAMENELLRHEVAHLRARLAAAERAAEQERTQGRQETQQDQQPSGGEASAEHAKAGEDLRWLLERLDRTPVGPLLRRRPRVREMRERWLGETE